MTYEEAIAYIHGMYWRGSKLGLTRTIELCHLLGDPQNRLKFIHVAGTNGKGSTCAMLSRILCAAGYRTGLFVSPYVDRFNERIQLNNTPIPDEDLAEIVSEIAPVGLPANYTGDEALYFYAIADASLAREDVLKTLGEMGISCVYMKGGEAPDADAELDPALVSVSDILYEG